MNVCLIFYRMWPQFVRDRVHATYGYFGASCAITAASAIAVFRTPTLLNLVTRNGFMVKIITFLFQFNEKPLHNISVLLYSPLLLHLLL